MLNPPPIDRDTLLTQLLAAEGIDAKWQVLARAFTRLGSEWLTYGQALPDHQDSPLLMTDVPVEMVTAYQQRRLYRLDPWVKISATTGRPFAASMSKPPPPGVPPELVAYLREFGVQTAIVVPAPQQAERISALIIYATNPGAEAALTSASTMKEASWLANLAAQLIPLEVINTSGHVQLYHPPILSPRETETLTLLAQGHQTQAIAHQMQVAPVTITKHLASARTKLGCKTREQTLARAISLGLVQV